MAALGGVALIGRKLKSPALLSHVITLGVPVYKRTTERNFAVRDAAMQALGWILRVCNLALQRAVL